jgi:hypothetical protein
MKEEINLRIRKSNLNSSKEIVVNQHQIFHHQK